MKSSIAAAFIMLCAAPWSSAAAADTDFESALQAIDDAVAESIEAANNVSDEDIERAQTERIAEINATMRLVANESSLGDSLPLPSLIGIAELEAAMAHDAAWLGGEIRSDRIRPLIDLAYSTGPLLYYERSCHTEKEPQVAGALFQELDRNLTQYPQRLIMKLIIDDRDFLSHGGRWQCSSTALESWRSRQAETFEILGA